MKEQQYQKINAIRHWNKKANGDMRKRLLEFAKTSPQMLWQWSSGRRNLSAEMASRIADASIAIYEANPESAPPPLLRGELCQACRTCPHFLSDLNDKIELVEID